MKFIKLGIISIAILFCMLTALGLLFPSTVVVSRAVNIIATKDSIQSRLANMHQWTLWMEGTNDTNTVVISDKKGKLGTTDVTIESASTDKIVALWVGKNGTQQTSTFNLFKDSSQAETIVQWEFQQHLKWYPWERFASMMNDKILGTMMEKNLSNLKTLIEKRD